MSPPTMAANELNENTEKQFAMLMVGALAVLWLTAKLFRVVVV